MALIRKAFSQSAERKLFGFREGRRVDEVHEDVDPSECLVHLPERCSDGGLVGRVTLEDLRAAAVSGHAFRGGLERLAVDIDAGNVRSE